MWGIYIQYTEHRCAEASISASLKSIPSRVIERLNFDLDSFRDAKLSLFLSVERTLGVKNSFLTIAVCICRYRLRNRAYMFDWSSAGWMKFMSTGIIFLSATLIVQRFLAEVSEERCESWNTCQCDLCQHFVSIDPQVCIMLVLTPTLSSIVPHKTRYVEFPSIARGAIRDRRRKEHTVVKRPSRKTPIRASFFRIRIWSFQSNGMGRRKMMIS